MPLGSAPAPLCPCSEMDTPTQAGASARAAPPGVRGILLHGAAGGVPPFLRTVVASRFTRVTREASLRGGPRAHIEVTDRSRDDPRSGGGFWLPRRVGGPPGGRPLNGP